MLMPINNMVKTQIIPCSKEEMDRLIEASIENDYYYMVIRVGVGSGWIVNAKIHLSIVCC